MEAGLWEGEQGCERSARELLVVMEPYHDCITEHPGCAAALQDVIIGGNGVKGTKEPRVTPCTCMRLLLSHFSRVRLCVTP